MAGSREIRLGALRDWVISSGLVDSIMFVLFVTVHYLNISIFSIFDFLCYTNTVIN